MGVNQKDQTKKILNRISKFDKLLILYLFILMIFLSYIHVLSSLHSDEGTHLLLSVFYKDLIIHLIQKNDFSFNAAYNFGINYLISYPKLQIAYPPMYHLTTSLFFYLFGITTFIGRFVNLIYTILSFLIFYLIIKKIFDPKTGFIATFLFSSSSISFTYAVRAMMDFTVLFWLLMSIFIFIIALKKNQKKLFALTGFITFLTFFSKQMGGFIIIFFLIILLKRFFDHKQKKQYLINIFILLFCFLLPLTPYLFLLNKVGGFEINKMVAIDYAYEQNEPTSIFDPFFWTYYIIKPVQISPFISILLFSLFLYSYQKKPHWKYVLLSFFIFYISLSLIPNKEPRFSQFFIFPAYFTMAFYLSKIKIKLIVISFLIIYLFVSLSWFLPSLKYYPIDQISKIIYQNIPKGGNVAFFSDGNPFHSSTLMWYLSTLDKNRTIRVYRSCIFDNKTHDQIIQILNENNIYFIIYSTWDKNNQTDKIKNELFLFKEIDKDGLITRLYTYKKFEFNQTINVCNYICLTNEMLCKRRNNAV